MTGDSANKPPEDLSARPAAESSGSSPSDGQLLAAIDLGSNSFHMIVARYEHGRLHVIDRLKEMVRLAEGVRKDRSLDPEVERRALECLARFGQRLEQISQTRIEVVGTNALRRMKDSWRFLNEAESRLGVPIEVISGHEEARLVYLGVAHGISERGRRMVIDIGGGSTEFAIGEDFKPLLLESMYFGCVGVSQKFFSNGKITKKRWKKAHTAVSVELQRYAESFQKRGFEEVLGSSGSMKAVRNVLLAQGWSNRGITREGIGRLRDELILLGHSDAFVFDGLSVERRPVFAGGAVIVNACMDVLDIDRIIVSEYALREGLLYDLVGRIEDEDPREATIQGLMERYHVDADQALRVEKVALDLFDQLAQSWDLAAASRDLVRWAACTHELGLTISHHGYHRHGAYLIQNSDMPGFSRQEQTILATWVRQHRRKPDASRLAPALEKIRDRVLRICAILRLAVLVNRTRSSHPLPAIEAQADQDHLTIGFQDGWLDEHPLTLADLEQETSKLRRLGIQLSLK